MASTEEVLAGLAELINDETGIATEAVELDKSFTDDLDIDSISMMTIVVNAEEKFDVTHPGRRGQEPQDRRRRRQLHRQRPGLVWLPPVSADPGARSGRCSSARTGPPATARTPKFPLAGPGHPVRGSGYGRRTDRE